MTFLSWDSLGQSSNPFSSPVLSLRYEDDTWQLSTDDRALNMVMIKEHFLICTMEDMLDELHYATFFTELDLMARCHQVSVLNLHKTIFCSHNGYYEYLVMLFGYVMFIRYSRLS